MVRAHSAGDADNSTGQVQHYINRAMPIQNTCATNNQQVGCTNCQAGQHCKQDVVSLYVQLLHTKKVYKTER